jgi:hypothetical protein
MSEHNISIRPKEGGPVYSPQRDWVNCMPVIIKRVAALFRNDAWPELYDTVAAAMDDTEGVETGKALTAAHDAYFKFLNTCTQDPKQTAEDVLRESGFLDVHPAAQMGYLAMLSSLFTGHLFDGLRDVTALGQTPDCVKLLEQYTKTGVRIRGLLNNMTPGDDLKVDLATIVRLLRNEDVPWSVIDRIINRERALDPEKWSAK